MADSKLNNRPRRGGAGPALKALAREAGLSVQQVADKLGRPKSSYQYYEDEFKEERLPLKLVEELVPIFEQRGIPRDRVLALGGDFPISLTSVGMAIIREQRPRELAENGLEEPSGGGGNAWQMPKDFLRAATDAAEGQIRIMTVVGDSMETTFRPYERIMVDVSDRQPSPPGIFVLFDGVGHVVKRVELVVGSNPPRVRISADNPRYSVYESALDEAGIEGRVLGKWQWV